MTIAQTLSLVLLFACLALAVWRHINIGVLALGACLVVLVVSGADSKEMYKAFPGSVFTLIVGVSRCSPTWSDPGPSRPSSAGCSGPWAIAPGCCRGPAS